jgi:YidC/Oxa1 family membrane protein insertase
MDRRIVLALILSALVFFVTPVLFPPPPSAPGTPGDTTAVTTAPAEPTEPAEPVAAPPAAPQPTVPAPMLDTVRAATDPAVQPPAVAETTVVVTERAAYRFSSLGAALVGAEMLAYRNLATPGAPVEMATPGAPLISYSLITARDTIDLRQINFSLSRQDRGASEVLEYRAPVNGGEVVVSYSLPRDTSLSYRMTVSGEASGVEGARHVLLWLPNTLSTAEADTADDRRHLAYAFKTRREGARSVGFGSLDPGERRLVEGPHAWAAAKTKYFVVGLLTPRTGEQQFVEATVEGGPRVARMATHATGTVAQPLRDGVFALEAYVGPQEWRRLLAVGQEFDQVNPYGWRFMQGIIQPFATVVMRILLWMHNALALSYGWVLVIFGVAVRVVLWPLNQKAMRASLKMQLLQPKLAEVQKKFANNPEKQRAEMMRVYKEAGASPFTALSGCLPMLIPMPFLVALFFIFQNTIEFRGVPFLWLQDISIKDPYYILPLAMGASMYVVSWIGMRNAPPSPQAKMMSYVFPVMLTFFLLNFAAGLNLYYAVQNLATIPQQWLLARERKRMAAAK